MLLLLDQRRTQLPITLLYFWCVRSDLAGGNAKLYKSRQYPKTTHEGTRQWENTEMLEIIYGDAYKHVVASGKNDVVQPFSHSQNLTPLPRSLEICGKSVWPTRLRELLELVSANRRVWLLSGKRNRSGHFHHHV